MRGAALSARRLPRRRAGARVSPRPRRANESALDGAELDPELIFNGAPGAIDGLPVVTPQGVVLGGNGRTQALQLHYHQGGTAAKDYLLDHAGQFGFSREPSPSWPIPSSCASSRCTHPTRRSTSAPRKSWSVCSISRSPRARRAGRVGGRVAPPHRRGTRDPLGRAVRRSNVAGGLPGQSGKPHLDGSASTGFHPHRSQQLALGAARRRPASARTASASSSGC
jgi:hypothetical protein